MTDKFTCYLFHEFCAKHIIDDLKLALPFTCEFHIHDSIADSLIDIYKTNAKLFFPKDTALNNIEAMIEVFQKFGFKVSNRNPFIEKFIEIEETVELPEIVVEKCPTCSHTTSKQKTIKIKKKVLQRYYSDDRVIFYYPL